MGALFNLVTKLEAPATLCDLAHVKDKVTSMEFAWCSRVAALARSSDSLLFRGRLGYFWCCWCRCRGRIVDFMCDGMEFD